MLNFIKKSKNVARGSHEGCAGLEPSGDIMYLSLLML